MDLPLLRIGNCGVELQVSARGGLFAVGVVFATARPGNLQLFGVDKLLDQVGMFQLGMRSSNGMLPVPIPSGAPVAAAISVHSLHLHAGASGRTSATSGQRLRLMRHSALQDLGRDRSSPGEAAGPGLGSSLDRHTVDHPPPNPVHSTRPSFPSRPRPRPA